MWAGMPASHGQRHDLAVVPLAAPQGRKNFTSLLSDVSNIVPFALSNLTFTTPWKRREASAGFWMFGSGLAARKARRRFTETESIDAMGSRNTTALSTRAVKRSVS